MADSDPRRSLEDRIRTAIASADIGGYGSTLDLDEAVEHVMAEIESVPWEQGDSAFKREPGGWVHRSQLEQVGWLRPHAVAFHKVCYEDGCRAEYGCVPVFVLRSGVSVPESDPPEDE